MCRFSRWAQPIGRARVWVIACVLHDILRSHIDGFILRHCDAQCAINTVMVHPSIGQIEIDLPV
eukprot:7473168-Pyramimonas_sp.AAC.1